MAMYAARAAQSHVGLARRLARDEGARIRRRDVIALAGQIRGVGHAVNAAADLAAIATEESSASSTERDAAERARLLETLGADPSARTQPPHVRSQVAALEREQKTRATRFARDVVDRSLVDLLSVYRDALVLHTGASIALVNQDMVDHVQRAGRRARPRAAAAGDGRDRHGPRADRRQRAAAAGPRGDGDLAAAASLTRAPARSRAGGARSRRLAGRCSGIPSERTSSTRSACGGRRVSSAGREPCGGAALGALAAGALAVALAVSGCSGLGLGGDTAAPPTDPAAEASARTPPSGQAGLARFYDQKLTWSSVPGLPVRAG